MTCGGCCRVIIFGGAHLCFFLFFLGGWCTLGRLGKGHTGYLSTAHLPTNKGFDTYLGYLTGAQNYDSNDRWANGAPYTNDTTYSSILYGDAAVKLIADHDAATPFFMYLAWQAVHSPYTDVPNWDNNCTTYLPYPGVYAGMINDADAYTGKMVDALVANDNMWRNTLLVYASDNGGVSVGSLAGINYPLRGEKHSNWQGGYRVMAFVAGGLVPKSKQGTSSNLRISIVDWYPTFCILGGGDPHDDPPTPPLPVDPSDPKKDIYGNDSYPGLDGVDVWGYLTSETNVSDWAAHPTLTVTSQVYLDHEYKLLLGQGSVGDSGEKTPQKDGWRYPNGTWINDPAWKCGLAYGKNAHYIPCLFEEPDIREMNDLSFGNAARVTAMWRALNTSLLTVFASRSPSKLVGPCNKTCASAYWKAKGAASPNYPICGVPGCTGTSPPPAPAPAPPVPPSPPSPVGPFKPTAATNCTYQSNTGSKDHTGAKVAGDVATQSDCCKRCFESSSCVLASFTAPSCFLHTTTTGLAHRAGVSVCVTGRVPVDLAVASASAAFPVGAQTSR